MKKQNNTIAYIFSIIYFIIIINFVVCSIFMRILDKKILNTYEKIDKIETYQVENNIELYKIKVQNDIIQNNIEKIIKEESIEDIIKRSAEKYNVSFSYMLKLAMCESTMNPKAIGYNGLWSIDRGIFQINSHYHPEVSDACAYDVECSAMWTAWQLSQKHGWMWTCIKYNLINNY